MQPTLFAGNTAANGATFIHTILNAHDIKIDSYIIM